MPNDSAVEPQSTSSDRAAPARSLSLFDSTSIVVGVIIGATIYESSPTIAKSVPNLAALVGVWLAGGLIALVGALCYAELATAFPQSGGGYVYLNRAFGPRTAALFAWAELCVVRPGSTGAIAFVFARYANKLYSLGEGPVPLVLYSAGAIIALSLVNLAGLQEGKWTQNILTTAKVLGLLLIFAAAIAGPGELIEPSKASMPEPPNLPLALILVMFAYGGWNEVAFVAAEVRDPRRNLPRTLLLGVALVTAVYIVTNLAFNHALGWDDFRSSTAVATDSVADSIGDYAGRLTSALICITTLGAVNGQLFTGARIYYAFGRDHRWSAPLGRWNLRTGTPAIALVVQCVITLVPVIAFGMADEPDKKLTMTPFTRMATFTMPVFWFFLLLIGVAFFVLRRQSPPASASFRVPLFPLTPALFVASSLLMLYATFSYAFDNRSLEAWWAIGVLAAGYLVTMPKPVPRD
jgi:amino acid transporter